MEQRRVVLVVVLSVVFVLALAALAIWQFYPNPQLTKKPINTTIGSIPTPTPTPVASNQPGVNIEASPIPAQSQTPSPSPASNGNPSISNNNEVVIVYGGNSTQYKDKNGKIISIGPNDSKVVETPKASDNATNNNVVQSLPSPSPKATSQPKASASPKPQSTPKPKNLGIYYIQVISSPSRDAVELLKKDLQVHGWNGIISSAIVNGKEFFRLRYGPFNGEAEAKKFLGYINSVKGLEKSFVVKG